MDSHHTDRDPQDYLPLTDLSFHVLLALGAGALHGYAIGKDIEQRSGGRLRPTTGSLYQALRRLHRDELIEEARAGRFPSSDARRQYFQLTDLGRKVFALEAERLEGLLAAARRMQLLPDRA
jgi:DNA-binding PadR family transcriptional regulator